jgi:hypothetical protein
MQIWKMFKFEDGSNLKIVKILKVKKLQIRFTKIWKIRHENVQTSKDYKTENVKKCSKILKLKNCVSKIKTQQKLKKTKKW